MAAHSSSSTLPESSSSRHHAYSRKQKSLGLLCSNFLSLYNRDGIHSVGLDDAASRLGVERRRIYDIVNVLESVGVLARRAKNQYSWKGFEAIPVALQQLKEEGLKENFNASDGNDYAKVSDDEDEDETLSNPATGSQNSISSLPKHFSSKSGVGSLSMSNILSYIDNRREKSLALLTRNFVKLFICSKVDLISLDEAARLLLGDGHNSSIMRTKVRRLYDIANVLSSMNLIEKTHASVTRKPAFRWLGWKDRAGKEATCSEPPPEPRKRAFGIDVTNINFKRNKIETSANENPKKDINITKSEKQKDLIYEVDRQGFEKESKQGTKCYHFGPFAPVTVASVGPQSSSKVKESPDWESLASTYRPQYQNQALKELFAHYMEAWKSWYSEAVEKPIKIS